MNFSIAKRPLAFTGAALLSLLLSGCAVVAVTSAAVSVTASVVGLAADTAVGTAKIVGKGVGKAADALLDDPAVPSAAITPVVASQPAPAVMPTTVEVGQPYGQALQATPLQPLALEPLQPVLP